MEDSAMEGAIDGHYAAAEEVENETGKYVGIWNRHKVYFYRHPTMFQKIRPPTRIYRIDAYICPQHVQITKVICL